MAQTTFQNLASGLSGLAFRNNTNTILDALFSANSGGSAPSPTVGGQFWLDTGVTPAVLRVRNAANTAWQVVLPATIPANTLWGNSTGSAAAPTSLTVANLQSMIGVSKSLTTAGFHRFEASGLIVQWHRFTSSSSAAVTWTFPTAFPVGCFGGQLTVINNSFGHVGTFDSTPSATSAQVSTWNGSTRTTVDLFALVLGW